MYGIYGNIYHQYTPNVSIYTIHGSYGLYWLSLSLSLSGNQSWQWNMLFPSPWLIAGLARLSRVASLRERPASAVLPGEKSGCCGIPPFPYSSIFCGIHLHTASPKTPFSESVLRPENIGKPLSMGLSTLLDLSSVAMGIWKMWATNQSSQKSRERWTIKIFLADGTAQNQEFWITNGISYHFLILSCYSASES